MRLIIFMHVKVNFFSYYRLIAGMETTTIQLPENAIVMNLIDELKKQISDLDSKLEQTAILINHQQASFNSALKDKDEISMLYIIGGG